ncbi:uncharacterized protein TM35_000351310 [Trypanosoma theileri]|uniref:Uncharacterized protein n=1 Tax=Trypanosoma theileri TaxID=67003 RepID=A0A1X0NL66_9TRYP|nr:uncharacterized protein TM35_000351310 [Trypanosoma theileri]ORC85387.1 hypothetical protein TM35_000351310 [Trypanosoma theileri]
MSQDRHRNVQSYTTALGTKAYILGNVWGGEASEDALSNEMSAEVQQHSLPSLRKHCTLPVRSRPWCKDVHPPYPSEGGKSKRRRVMRESGKRLITTSLDNNTGPGITDELRHLLPTQIVVPPVMHTASSEAPLPLPTSYWRIPLAPLNSSSNNSVGVISSEPLETKSFNAINTTKHSLYDVSTHQVTDLPPNLPKIFSPTPPSNIHQTDLNNNFSHCSMEDHQSMLENGFVYCPDCGVRVSYAPLVEYSPQECPVTHEKLMCDMESNERRQKKYCILCGFLIKNQTAPLKENQERETRDGKYFLSMNNSSARVLENVRVEPPYMVPGQTLIATALSEPLTGFKTDGDEKKRVQKEPGNIDSHFTVRNDGNFPSQTATEFQTRVDYPLPAPSGTAASSSKESGGTEAFTKEKALGSSAMLTVPLPPPPTAAAASARSVAAEKEESRLDKTVESPFTSMKGRHLENASGVGVQASTSAGKAVDVTAVKREFLYTAGVSGVYCGLPNCALCVSSVDSSSPHIGSSCQHSPVTEVKRHDEASVIVVHNHYYHKM